jgi:glycosyltransferase involved in cell wall biosynthesis
MITINQPNLSTKKLLIISGTWPPMPCGIGDYTARLAEHLSKRGLVVHVLTSRAAEELPTGESNTGLIVHPLVLKWDWNILREVRRFIFTFKPDAVNIQWPTYAYRRSLAINFLPFFIRTTFPSLPQMVTIHEFRYFHFWTRFRLLPTFFLARKIIAIDPQDIPFMKRIAPWIEKRITTIPVASNLPAVPLDFDRETQRRQLGIAPEDFVFCFFGFANTPKGLEYLIPALKQVMTDFPKVKFLLLSQLSKDNHYQRKIKHDLDNLGHQSRIINPPYVPPETAAGYLACADCAVLPFVDGISVKRTSLIACLTQGVPVISTEPQYREVSDFVHGVNVWLVPPKNPSALVQAMTKLFQDSDLRARLALGAWDLARYFSWDAIARDYHQVINEVSVLHDTISE